MAEIAALGLKIEGVQDVEKASSALDGFASAGERAEKSTLGLGKESGRTRPRIKGVGDASEQASRGADRLSGKLKGLSGDLASAARGALGFAAAALSIGAIGNTLASFEQSMAAVAGITRATGKELADLRDLAKEVGSSTEFSASQAAEGIKFLGMAGFTATQTIEAYADVVDLATAAQMDLGQAADIASNIMAAFGIKASEAAKATDVIAAVATQANTDVRQLGDAMTYVGPIASSMGISINDTAAAIGVLSDAGLRGSMAGTGLRRILSSLANPTRQASDLIGQLGINMADLNPTTNSMVDIIDRLAQKGLTAAEAFTIFGDRGAPAVLALIESREGLNSLTESMGNVEGAAKTMADTFRDNLRGDFVNVTSALEGLIVSLGEAGLISVLRLGAQALAAMLRSATGLMDGIGRVANSVGSLLAPAFDMLKPILMTVASNIDIVLAVLAAMAAPTVLGGIATLTVAIGTGLVGAVHAVTAAMLANPLGVLIAGLAAATYAIYKFSDDLENILGFNVKNAFISAANFIIGSFVAAYEDIKYVWSNFGDMMGAAVVGGVNFAIRAINRLIEGTVSGIDSLIDALNTIPGVEISKIGNSASISLLDNKFADRLAEATAKRNQAVQDALSRDYLGAVGERLSSPSGDGAIGSAGTVAPPRGELGSAGAGGAKKQASELASLVDQLKRQQATLGMTAEQAERYAIETAKGSAAEREMALALFDSVQAWKEQEKAMQFAIDSGKQYLAFEREMDVFRERAQLSVAAIGMGNRSRELAEEEYNIRQHYAEKRLELEQAQQVASTALEQEQYDERLNMLRLFEEEKLLVTQEAAAMRAEAEADWVNGLTAAWENFADNARNIASQVDDLFSDLLSNMSASFGNAFEKMIFDSENFGDAMRNMASTMLRSVVNALAQMAAQWLTYQAVQLLVGRTTQVAGASALSANATASSLQAGISAYASTAAIPIVGPILAPAAMATALAATAPMAAAVGTAALAGMAHDGIDSIPETGTWLLEKGERVTTANTSARLDATLERVDAQLRESRSTPTTAQQSAAPIINVIEDASKAGRQEVTRNEDGSYTTDVFVANILGGGTEADVLESTYGLTRVGR